MLRVCTPAASSNNVVCRSKQSRFQNRSSTYFCPFSSLFSFPTLPFSTPLQQLASPSPFVSTLRDEPPSLLSSPLLFVSLAFAHTHTTIRHAPGTGMGFCRRRTPLSTFLLALRRAPCCLFWAAHDARVAWHLEGGVRAAYLHGAHTLHTHEEQHTGTATEAPALLFPPHTHTHTPTRLSRTQTHVGALLSCAPHSNPTRPQNTEPSLLVGI